MGVSRSVAAQTQSWPGYPARQVKRVKRDQRVFRI